MRIGDTFHPLNMFTVRFSYFHFLNSAVLFKAKQMKGSDVANCSVKLNNCWFDFLYFPTQVSAQFSDVKQLKERFRTDKKVEQTISALSPNNSWKHLVQVLP